jgi:outer membrane protein assembly factor BamB
VAHQDRRDLTAGVGSDGDVVVVGGVKGQILAYDANGKQLWKAQASAKCCRRRKSAAAWWWCAASTTDHGFDAKTGERKWTVARTTPALTLRNAPGMVINGRTSTWPSRAASCWR